MQKKILENLDQLNKSYSIMRDNLSKLGEEMNTLSERTNSQIYEQNEHVSRRFTVLEDRLELKLRKMDKNLGKGHGKSGKQSRRSKRRRSNS